MRLNIFSPCVLDTILINDISEQRQGGPACYCGLTARNLRSDVNLFTRFGRDFDPGILVQAGINVINQDPEAPTTRFEIHIDGADRRLVLQNRCGPLEYEKADADGAIVSPVFDEISPGLLEQIKADHDFVFLDPQGFVRRAGAGGEIHLEETGMNLGGVSAIKLNPAELAALQAGDREQAMQAMQERGVAHVLYSDGRDISLLHQDRIYSLVLPNKAIRDSTGVGDIFSAAYCCTMMRERDFLWAFCFACGAAQAALDSGLLGLDKVPSRKAVETNASYFYNTVKFRQV